MNYNIALSSFVYILIFIFPGVLFRKFYYIGPFTKQFNNGNLFERFIITMFLSVISVTLSGLIVFLLRDILHFPFLSSISYTTVYNVLNSLKDNKLPEPKTFKETYWDFLILLLLLFSLSASLGSFCYMIVTTLKLDRLTNVFKFNDKWHYHVKGKNNSKIKTEKYLYTEVNVLIQDGNSEKTMYSGYLNDYTVDENNTIKSVLIEDTKRYSYNNLKNIRSNREREIRGSLMYISCESVMNINFTHIFEPILKKTWKQRFYLIAKITFWLLYLATFILFWLDDVIWHFDYFWQKTLFIVFSILTEIMIFNGISDTITVKEKKMEWAFIYLQIIIICLGPVVFAMDIIPSWLIIISIITITICNVIILKIVHHFKNNTEEIAISNIELSDHDTEQ